MDNAVISIDSLDKHFGKKQVLKGVNLKVAPGSIFGFLGPNGAGKTTTIRCLMDFIRPDSGTITIFGKNANNNSNLIKKSIGYLSAESQLIDKWNGAKHLAFYRSAKGTQFNNQLFSLLKLDPDLPVKYMSSGNKQKLGFILSLVGNPRLLILDEPTRGLDPLIQNEVYKILRDYVSNGGTVFISSHNLEEVERLCNDVAIIRDGVIVADKSLSEISAMKTHIVSISFLPSQKFSLPPISGTTTLESQLNKVVLKVQGDINPLIKELSKHQLANLEITHAPLEEIFMDYYRK